LQPPSVANLNFTDPAIATTLNALIFTAGTPTTTMPVHATHLFLADPSVAASPSIHCFLTDSTSSPAPTYCCHLDYLNNQAAFNAVFLPNDHIPISSLQPTSTLPSPAATGPDQAMHAFTAACHLPPDHLQQCDPSIALHPLLQPYKNHMLVLLELSLS
jgi:hypothetical protein